MQRVIVFGLFSALSVGQGVVVAQGETDSALGAWTLNRAKSTFGDAAPYGRVTKFEVVGDAIKETTYTFSTSKPSVLVEYTARFDGNDYPISNSILSTVSLKRVDDRSVERTGKIRGQVVETEIRTVSDNGNVLTVTTKRNMDGTEYRAFRFTIDNHPPRDFTELFDPTSRPRFSAAGHSSLSPLLTPLLKQLRSGPRKIRAEA